jgi:hypothetical protein
LAFDLVHGAIVAVEVLDRPDVKTVLDAGLPVQPADLAAGQPCPACGFLTASEDGYGSYTICDVCDWEDDGVQLANPACGGGASSESLIEAQRAILNRFPVSVAETAGFRRSPAWRPLNEAEIAIATAERGEAAWKNPAIVGLHGCYWNRQSV